jgi:transglutaminase-like putative cysteine protease
MSGPFLDPSIVDLKAATRITYRIEQSFHYTYAAPVTSLSHRLVVVPRRRHGDLHRRAHRVDVTGTASQRRTVDDPAGNTVVLVTADRVEHSVGFHIEAVLERLGPTGPVPLAADAIDDPALLAPTRLTAPDDRLRDLAADVARPGGEPLDVAERVCAAVSAALEYQLDVTTIATTAAQALAAGRGVCQDAAHVMVAVARLCGLPARYVSGHLLGEGGTHAWAEVVVANPGAAAVAFDPSHGRRTDNRYITVAVGRDYADVAPTSGTFVGPPGGHLSTRRRVGVVSIG